jgi:hypothetical protein
MRFGPFGFWSCGHPASSCLGSRVEGTGCVDAACFHIAAILFKVWSRRSNLSTRIQCLQQVDVDQAISKQGMKVVRCTPPVLQLRKFLFPDIGDGHLDRPHLGTSFQPPRGGLHFRDSSMPLFSMYSKVAEEKDNKMVERWQKDVEGILIFVSPRTCIHAPIHLNWSAVGRLIFRRRRHATFYDDPRPTA